MVLIVTGPRRQKNIDEENALGEKIADFLLPRGQIVDRWISSPDDPSREMMDRLYKKISTGIISSEEPGFIDSEKDTVTGAAEVEAFLIEQLEARVGENYTQRDSDMIRLEDPSRFILPQLRRAVRAREAMENIWLNWGIRENVVIVGNALRLAFRAMIHRAELDERNLEVAVQILFGPSEDWRFVQKGQEAKVVELKFGTIGLLPEQRTSLIVPPLAA